MLTIPFTGVPISVRRSTPVSCITRLIPSGLLAYSPVFAIMQIMSQQHNSDRIRRAGKLIMLEWLVPLFVRKRTTDFLLPQIDPAWFTKLGIQWGVWRMSEPEFSEFEKKMLTVYTDTLASVSPAFKNKVFAKVDDALRMGASLSMAADTIPPRPTGEEIMPNQLTPQWQPIEKLPLIASLIDGTLDTTSEQYESLTEAKQQPYSLDDALVNRAIKAFTNQKGDLLTYDEQLTRWKAQRLTPKQHAEVERLNGQMKKLHKLTSATLALAEELQELTIERLLEKDDAEVGLEYLLGTLGKPQNKSTTHKPSGVKHNPRTDSTKKPQTATNGLCECISSTPCVNCRFYESKNTPEGRKALSTRIFNFLVSRPLYEHLVSQTLPTIFPNKIVYEDEKDLVAMLFEAVIFDVESGGETPLAYFLSHAPLDEKEQRLYKAWQTHNHYGFYLVQKIIPEKEIHLTDLAGKTAYKVYETSGTRTVKEGTVVIARLVPFLDGWMIYTENIVSFGNASPEFMAQSAGIPIPQLAFILRYRQEQERRHNMG